MGKLWCSCHLFFWYALSGTNEQMCREKKNAHRWIYNKQWILRLFEFLKFLLVRFDAFLELCNTFIILCVPDQEGVCNNSKSIHNNRVDYLLSSHSVIWSLQTFCNSASQLFVTSDALLPSLFQFPSSWSPLRGVLLSLHGENSVNLKYRKNA